MCDAALGLFPTKEITGGSVCGRFLPHEQCFHFQSSLQSLLCFSKTASKGRRGTGWFYHTCAAVFIFLTACIARAPGDRLPIQFFE